MKEKIKIIGGRILKIFVWIIFLFSICLVLFVVIPDLYQYGISGWVLNDWIGLFVMLGIIFGFGYILRNTLLIPFRAFGRLNFERKMMLFVVIAIMIGVGFYSWLVYERQDSLERCVTWCWVKTSSSNSLFYPNLFEPCINACKISPDFYYRIE